MSSQQEMGGEEVDIRRRRTGRDIRPKGKKRTTVPFKPVQSSFFPMTSRSAVSRAELMPNDVITLWSDVFLCFRSCSRSYNRSSCGVQNGLRHSAEVAAANSAVNRQCE